MKRRIEPSDIISNGEYATIRAGKRSELAAVKRLRRVEVGPFAMFAFESWDTMWFQVQEMLFIEKAGPEQIPDEIAAYNPLIPDGSELVATVMLQIDSEIARKAALAKLGGIEEAWPRPTWTAPPPRARRRRCSSSTSRSRRPRSRRSASPAPR